jgi:hypothetical protein
MKKMRHSILIAILLTAAAVCQGETKPEFLFSLRVVRTFHHLVEFAVMTNGSEGTLHIVVKEGMAGFTAGPFIRDERMPLTKNDVEKFRSLLSQVDRSMQGSLPGYTDGSTWVLATDDGIGTARISCACPDTEAEKRRTVGLWTLGEYLWTFGNFDHAKDKLY